jgi:hypothetical protein
VLSGVFDFEFATLLASDILSLLTEILDGEGTFLLKELSVFSEFSDFSLSAVDTLSLGSRLYLEDVETELRDEE